MNARGTLIRRLLAGALMIVAILLAVFAFQQPKSADDGKSMLHLSTPLWSPRRAPQSIVDTVGSQRLQVRLAEISSGVDHCFDVRDAAQVVAVENTPEAFIPASSLKLLTAAGVLFVLGPDFRYSTRAIATSEPENGSIETLFLVGAGDPTLTTPEGIAALNGDRTTAGNKTTPLDELAERIVAAGVTSIPGGVVGVDSRYDSQRFLPQWPSEYRTEVGPIGALVVDSGKVLTSKEAGSEKQPALHAATELSRLLALRGVALGSPGTGSAPDSFKPIAEIKSGPMSEILTSFLSSSDNVAGEMLLKELAVRSGKPGTTVDGVKVLTQRLTKLGIPMGNVTLVDGSGLSRENKLTCDALVAVLNLSNKRRYSTLRDGLAIAGDRGTLAPRFQGSALTGKLWAKTGSLSGVSALAGQVKVRRPLDFALILNGAFSEQSGLSLRERMATAIASFPDSPPPEPLVPSP